MAHSVRNGTVSPPLTSTGSYSTTTTGQKLNVVSRLAIEGKVKQGSDTASVKLYMKLTASVDSVSPGQIIPLFAEENVKIRDYQVHPLDADSVPYVFSSTTNPLLHNAARALNLPARSTKSYLSLFESASQASTSRSGNANGSVIPPLEERYTGYFLISGYSVCFVLPKEFPPQFRTRNASTDSDGDGLSGRSMSKSAYKSRRRSSIIGRQSLQFMVGLDIAVPLSSKPPKAPYMLTIPIPRCLSNTVKVHLPPPAPVSTSFASLSSEEDSPGWDLATEPHVARASASKHRSRSSAYNDFADDESSEGSSHYSSQAQNCIVQGTFTSADHLQIRWASPLSMQNFPERADGRRRARVNDVRAQMTCTVLERVLADGEGSVRMRLDYQGVCSGVWFPGVATLLGLDVALDTHGCRVVWPGGVEGQWSIDSDPAAALTGFSVGLPERNISRQDSLEIPHMSLRSSPEPGFMENAGMPARSSSGSSTSLLRQQLPRQISTDISFEDSATPPTSALPSSLPSLATSMISSVGYGLSPVGDSQSPSTPITLHMNMAELQPIGKNKFTFNVSGTLVVSRSPGMQDSIESSGWDTIPIPVFKMPSAENETISTTVRNQCDGANVEVLGSTTSSRQGQSKKTVVPNGSQLRCGTEGSEILVKPINPKVPVKEEANDQLTPSLLRTRREASGSVSQPASPESVSALDASRRLPTYRDGPLIIPWVTAEAVYLPSEGDRSWKYGVTLSMPTPLDGSSEWLEFGLALPKELELFSTISQRNVPKVEVACASVNGIPVRYETYGHFEPEDPDTSVEDSLASEKRAWLTWMRVYINIPGALEVVYTVEGKQVEDRKGKRKASIRNAADVIIFLPMFSIPIGKFSVVVQPHSDFSNPRGNANHPIEAKRSCAVNVRPFSDQSLTIAHPSLMQNSQHSLVSRTARGASSLLMVLLPLILCISLLGQVVNMRLEIQELRRSAMEAVTLVPAPEIEVETKTVTITVSAIHSSPTSTTGRRWLGETYTLSYLKPGQTSSATLHDETPPAAQQASEPRLDHVDSEPAPEPEPESESGYGSDTIGDEFSSEATSIISYIYLPVSWLHFHYQNAAYEQLKQDVLTGWGKAWRVLRIIYHWPLSPDADI